MIIIGEIQEDVKQARLGWPDLASCGKKEKRAVLTFHDAWFTRRTDQQHKECVWQPLIVGEML